ncbi:hypothetical protein KRZ98_13135 [Sphingobium sp. AS12]|uniref:hypothetical protein n=1 Tax=Sphingobium sp. AS12 TaxID=2849495 RepID=UPI001C31A92A|nr:hypothetical protein [Sphingobium sp. AS12]MBV2149215.1 hypothetical protein [Sphingobium sp. AS12]
MPFKEITHCVQRLEMLEERAGIEISGLMVSVNDEADADGEYKVSIMGEITARGGSTIEHDVEIKINCYNSNRQVCGTSTVYFSSNDFYGIETLDDTVYSKGFPVDIKIVAKIIK